MYLVATFLFISGNEVLKRWKNLRDSFAKAEKKMKDGKASGSQATKKRKYIFSNELQFLKKIYTGREVTESHSPEVEEEGATEEVSTEKRPKTPEVTINEKSKTRKHKKMDDVDLKIIKALESTKETPDSNMSFFQSLMPHIANFNNSEILQFQMGVLQVISNIKNQQTLVPPKQGFPTPFSKNQCLTTHILSILIFQLNHNSRFLIHRAILHSIHNNIQFCPTLQQIRLNLLHTRPKHRTFRLLH